MQHLKCTLKDWRCLNDLAIEDGYLRDFVIVPEAYSGYLGVNDWVKSMGTVAGKSNPTNGAFSVADPRAKTGALQYQQYGVRRWEDTTGAVIGVKSPGQGTFSVADPRRSGAGFGKYQVTPYASHANCVISGSTTGQGAFAVQDPRPGMRRSKGDAYLTGGHYGVVPWNGTAGGEPEKCERHSYCRPGPIPRPATRNCAQRMRAVEQRPQGKLIK